MRCPASSPVLLLLAVLAPATLAAQKSAHPPGYSAAHPPAHLPAPSGERPGSSSLLSSHDGLSVIGAALESRGPAHAKPDCSHFVHSIYQRAGFPYTYASSSGLFTGVREFRRVTQPQPGDLVAWPGHVGIVVNPSQTSFFSSLRTGLGVESYSAPYWKERGPHRFYRYTKSPSTLISSHEATRGTTRGASHATTGAQSDQASLREAKLNDAQRKPR